METFKIPVNYIVTSEYLLEVEAKDLNDAIEKARFLIKYLVKNNIYDDIAMDAIQIDEHFEVAV